MWSCDWTIRQHHFHFHSQHRFFLLRTFKRHVRYSRWFLWSERYFKTFLCTFLNFERINSLLSWRDADTIDRNLSLVVCSLVSCLLKSFNGFQRRFVHIRHACVPGGTVAVRSTHYVYNSNQIFFINTHLLRQINICCSKQKWPPFCIFAFSWMEMFELAFLKCIPNSTIGGNLIVDDTSLGQRVPPRDKRNSGWSAPVDNHWIPCIIDFYFDGRYTLKTNKQSTQGTQI